MPGFNRLRMQHAQLKPQPPQISNAMTTATIQQLTQQTGAGQQGTIMAANINMKHNNNYYHHQHSNVPVAFVEFRDTQSAGQAMQLLQGKYLLSSDRGAMRIEYAKSKMAANEQFIATSPMLSSAHIGRTYIY